MYRHNNKLGQNRGAPRFSVKKWPKLGKNSTFFTENGGAPRFLTQFVVMPIHPLDPTQNYNNTWGILKIPPSGRTLGRFPRTFWRKIAKISKKMFFPTLNAHKLVRSYN